MEVDAAGADGAGWILHPGLRAEAGADQVAMVAPDRQLDWKRGRALEAVQVKMTSTVTLEIGQYRQSADGTVYRVARLANHEGVDYAHLERPCKFNPKHVFQSSAVEKMAVVDRPYWEDERVDEELFLLSRQRMAINAEIEKLKKQVAEIRAAERTIQSHCEHEWMLGDEQEGKRGWLGQDMWRECECAKCGLTETSYYTRL